MLWDISGRIVDATGCTDNNKPSDITYQNKIKAKRKEMKGNLLNTRLKLRRRRNRRLIISIKTKAVVFSARQKINKWGKKIIYHV